MEARNDEDTRVSTRDVDRVEKGIRRNMGRAEVFPKLAGSELGWTAAAST